jgi:predicted CopG family antitoxin
MKRLPVEIDDDVWKELQSEALQSRCSTSELVRRAVREKYLTTRKEALLSAIGLWKDRTDLPDTETYVSGLRSDDRLKRLLE